MKKTLSIILCALFVFAMTICGCGGTGLETKATEETTKEAAAETTEISTELVGGWNLATLEMTDEAKTAFDVATKKVTDESYTLEALLGTQLVSGTNYLMLCKKTDNDGETKYVVITVYADLNGGAEITSEHDCD